MGNHLRFAHIEYSISTRSLDIFSIGCDGSCKGCFNQEIKDWNIAGISTDKVISKVLQLGTKYGNLIDRLILVGGDPVDAYNRYPDEYSAFIEGIRTLNKPIFLFTRYELKEINKNLLGKVDYVKTGAYIPELTTDNNIQYDIKLATSNQRIYKVGV